MVEKNKLVAFCCYNQDNSTLETAEEIIQEQLESIERTFPNHKIVKYFSITKKKKLLSNFQHAVSFSNENNAFLAIGYFAPFQRNLKALCLLRDHSIKFCFIDLNTIQFGATLDVLINYLAYTKRIKGDKIKYQIKKRSANGEKQGLAKAEKKVRLEVVAIANYTRKFNTFINPKTKELRQKIYETKEFELLSYQKIADRLNHENYKTERGKRFGAKTVERLHKTQVKLYDFFKESAVRKVQKVKGIVTKNAQKIEINGFNKFDSFNDIMEFSMTDGISNSFVFKLYNNNHEEIFKIGSGNISESIGDKEIKISLNLKELKILFPGLYYMTISSNDTPSDLDQKNQITLPFYFYGDALPTGSLRPRTLPPIIKEPIPNEPMPDEPVPTQRKKLIKKEEKVSSDNKMIAFH